MRGRGGDRKRESEPVEGRGREKEKEGQRGEIEEKRDGERWI